MAPSALPSSPKQKGQEKTVLGARVKRSRPKNLQVSIEKVVKVIGDPQCTEPPSPIPENRGQEFFRFLDLPGELRNRIYELTLSKTRQALIRYCPRRASLRPRKPHQVLAQPRRSYRPFHNLTQVCRQIRYEYRPLYLAKQEIGMDLVNVFKYLETFYPTGGSNPVSRTDGRIGNITIALSTMISKQETSRHGIDLWPMLDIWANSCHIEAGFGRYGYQNYDSANDGEAKDMYRIFGRTVLPSRRCSTMNITWRDVLCGRKLAALRIFRKPKGTEQPYIHILFKNNDEDREDWMNGEDSTIPRKWLTERGFGRMEHFNVKVGAITDTQTLSSKMRLVEIK